MRPLVIYIDSESKKITMSKEQFEKYLRDAYNNGYDDGYAEGKKNYWWSYNTINTSQLNTPIRYTTATEPDHNYSTITCEANNTIGDLQ